MKDKKLIIFDLDGTLIDSVTDLKVAVNYMREKFNLPPHDDAAIKSFVGNGIPKLVERAIADAPEMNLQECLKIVREYYTAHSTDYTQAYPEVLESLKTLKEKSCVLSVFTNKFSDAAEMILAQLKLSQYLDEIIGSDSGFPLKPEGDAILYLMNKYQISAENTYMVGDHYTDLEAGRKANCKRVFAAYGIGKTQDEKFDFLINSFSELITIISSEN